MTDEGNFRGQGSKASYYTGHDINACYSCLLKLRFVAK